MTRTLGRNEEHRGWHSLTAEAEAVEVADEDTLSEVVALPEVAPVAAMRASRSTAVVQVMLVPAEFTNGSAAQLCNTTLDTGTELATRGTHMSPLPHDVRTNWPLTHWANSSFTQASSPVVQDEFALSVLNWSLKRKHAVRGYSWHNKRRTRRTIGHARNVKELTFEQWRLHHSGVGSLNGHRSSEDERRRPEQEKGKQRQQSTSLSSVAS